jgi:Rhodopirellula transposase DDE domain
MIDHQTIECIRQKYALLRAELDERARRCWAATEAMALGYGGVSAVAQATRISRNTISAGLRELQALTSLAPDRIRCPGAGRKPLTQTDPGLQAALEALVEPATRGDPQSPLRWTCKSTRRLAEELNRQGHPVCPRTVARLLRQGGYSLQANQKTREGCNHPDRNAQFQFINNRVRRYQRRGWPVLSVDTKKKELLGDFKNAGREWQPQGCPEPVRVHDFLDKKLGKAIPYGVYDVLRNRGWVSVGIDHDTARFAVSALRRWWRRRGASAFSQAGGVLITADGGGSNSCRNRLWKVALQEWADESGWSIAVSHFPPGTSKWNPVEHRLFCHITNNWRGRPLLNVETVVELIAQTTTRAGLLVEAEADTNHYPTGIKVSDAQLQAVRLHRQAFHGEWNYTIKPNC